jgi:hypothetical protein
LCVVQWFVGRTSSRQTTAWTDGAGTRWQTTSTYATTPLSIQLCEVCYRDSYDAMLQNVIRQLRRFAIPSLLLAGLAALASFAPAGFVHRSTGFLTLLAVGAGLFAAAFLLQVLLLKYGTQYRKREPTRRLALKRRDALDCDQLWTEKEFGKLKRASAANA